MCDAPDVPCDTLHATSKHDDRRIDTSRPKTPLPDSSRTLHRTISYASIDTVRPSSRKGVRRCIDEIANNLKQKATRKKSKCSSTQDVPKNSKAALDPASDSKASPESKSTRRGQKATAPLRNSSHKSEEESALAIADRIHSGVPSEGHTPSTFLGCESESLIDEQLPKEEGQAWEDCSFPIKSLKLGARFAMEHEDTFQSQQTTKIDIKGVQLDIRPSESDMTIWDGLQAAHHLFKCRLFLRCTTHLYDTVCLPDIPRVEMNCNTCPVGSCYARPPVLQTAYEGASPSRIPSSSGVPNVTLAAGIHIDKFWRTILNDDDTWGWYRDAFIPLSPRLFDKTEYREFKLISRVWVGESCVEGELTFGISMLLREVDMR